MLLFANFVKENTVAIRPWMMIGLLCMTHAVYASSYPNWGASLSVPLITKDPEYLHGYRAAVWYQPKSFIWKNVQVYVDASFGHWWVTNTTAYNNLNIYSVAPIVRVYFTHGYVSPFMNASIGLAYLSRTQIDHQNLGMHFAFQDQLGVGVTLGIEQQFSISLGAMHYSNGSLCKKNAGITIPVVFNVEYGFA